MEVRKFDTGAIRDADADATRYDLISVEGLRRLAETYAEGAKKYDDHNWRKGMPFSATANHAIRHVYKWLAGLTDEDHLAHAAWGLFALMEFEKTHPQLDDRYRAEPPYAQIIEKKWIERATNNWKPFSENGQLICADTLCSDRSHFSQETQV